MEILEKPRLRGVFHQYAFYVAVVAGSVLVALSDSGRELVATWIYAVALAAMFGVSALYHRVNWRSARVRKWMRRLDHSTILLLIAGTYTPFALLAFDGRLADAILIVVWTGAAAGLVLNLFWVDAPTWLTALVFIALGWVGVVAVPELLDLGVAPAVLVFVGGAPLHGRRARLRVQAPEPGSGDLRLPRDLPPVRDRRRDGPFRRDRGVRPASGLTRRQRPPGYRLRHDNEDRKDGRRVARRAQPGAVRDPPAQGHRARVHRRVRRHEGARRVSLCRVRSGALPLRGEVRLRLRLAELRRAGGASTAS